MREEELKALLQAEEKAALGYQGGQLSEDRTDALDYYYGKPLGTEVEGRSKVVSTDVADTIEWIMPALMKIFFAGDDVVSCEPADPKSLEEAKQLEMQAKRATEYNNHIFLKDNPGFIILHTMFKDGLLQKTGIVKSYPEFSETEEVDEFIQVTDGEHADTALKKEEDPTGRWYLKEHTEEPGPFDPVDGPTVLHTGVWCRTIKRMKICHDPIPPDEFLVSRDAKHDIDEIAYMAHRSKKTASHLIDVMGIPKAKVDKLSSDDSNRHDTEVQARQEGLDEDAPSTDRAIANRAMRKIWVTEAYIRVDWDGDGIAEMRRVLHAGSGTTILENEDWEGPRPFSVASPILMPHRLIGRSVADLVMDLQLLKSTLWRLILDNLYLVNTPQKYVDPSAVDLDDLLQPRVGSIVRPPPDGQFRADAIFPIVTPPVAQHTFPMLEYIDSVKENRTGVTAYNQGTDADTLNKTARGITQIMTASQQRIELIARVFAETGVKPIFEKQNWYLRRYPELAKRLILGKNNQWVDVDPAQWGSDFNLTINVGIGTGNKDQMLMHLQTIAAIQKEIVMMQQGVQGPLVTAQNIYATCTKMVENSGFKNPEEFFTDPQNAGEQPPKPPSPDEMKVQAQIEGDKAKLQMEGQKLQMEQGAKQEQAQTDRQNKIEEFQLKRELAIMEFQLKEKLAYAELALKAQAQEVKAQQDAEMQAVKVGMDSQRAETENAIKVDSHETQKRDNDETKELMKQGFATIAKAMAASKKISKQPDGSYRSDPA